MQNNIDVKTLSVTELKATVYDNLAQIEQCQKNIKILNQELANRHQTPVETPVKEEESDADTAE